MPVPVLIMDATETVEPLYVKEESVKKLMVVATAIMTMSAVIMETAVK